MQSFPTTQTHFLLPGPAGDLEVVATPASEAAQKQAVAVICHPHPMFGGTMNNKVVTTLERTFKELGLSTVRFNFRGVGKSAGTFDEGRGEKQDLLAVIDWVKATRPIDALWLAGFSFGGFIAASVAVELPVAQLVTVAPQVSRFKEAHLTSVTVPWVLVQGEDDEVVSPAETFEWIETINPQPVLIRMPAAGHYFHGKLLELRQKLMEVLTKLFDIG